MKPNTNRALEMPETARSGRLAYSRESLKRFCFSRKREALIAVEEEGENTIWESLGILNNDHFTGGFDAQFCDFSGKGIGRHG